MPGLRCYKNRELIVAEPAGSIEDAMNDLRRSMRPASSPGIGIDATGAVVGALVGAVVGAPFVGAAVGTILGPKPIYQPRRR